MNILLYVFRGFNMQDYYDCLVNMGNKVKLVYNNQQDIREYNEAVYNQVDKAIEDFKPDFVLSMAYFEHLSNLCEKRRLKYASWVFDNPMNGIYSSSAANSCNYIFFFDKSQYNEFKGYGFKHIYYLPLSANVERLDKINICDADLEKYSCEVSFVGRLYENNKYNELKKVPGYIRGYVDALLEAQLNFVGYNFIGDALTNSFVEMFKELIGISDKEAGYAVYRRLIDKYYLSTKCTEVERKRVLNDITAYANLTIYSDVSLESIPNAIKKSAVEPYEEMYKVFKATKINLNITLKSITEGLPLRIFDIMGAGGFVLTNYQAGIEEWFDIGKELEVYYSLEDLKDKIGYYLNNEAERKKIAYNGYKKVSQYHSTKHKLKYIIDEVGRG